MSKSPTIHLGYEVGTGEPVRIPLAHTFVAGQTQVSGKTTTLQAIVARSGRRALAFVTKRGESMEGRLIRPYLPREGHQAIHWRFVETIMASALGQRALKYERLQIINAAKDALSLDDVRQNLTRLLAKSKQGSPAAGIYELLGEYLDLVLPEMRALNAVHELDLQPGLNVMDLVDASPEMQALAIGAAIGKVNDYERDILTVFPEAWQFAPRDRNTAAKFAVEKTARMGSVIGNLVLSDSQDIVGVSPVLRQQSTVWIIGVQSEANELKRTLEVIKSKGIAAPRPAAIATLEVGQFFACHGRHAIKTYVQPAWMSTDEAQAIAKGMKTVDDVQRPAVVVVQPAAKPIRKPQIQGGLKPAAALPTRPPVQQHDEDDMAKEDIDRLEKAIVTMGNSVGELVGVIKSTKFGVAPASKPAPSTPRSSHVAFDEDELYERFKTRLLNDLPLGGGVPIVVTPPEKLRKDFQREEVERILASVHALKSLPKQMLRLVEAVGYLSQRKIAERLGRSLNGDFGAAAKELASLGFAEIHPKLGIGSTIRAKIAGDLESYKPSEEEITAVYQNVLHAIATEDGE